MASDPDRDEIVDAEVTEFDAELLAVDEDPPDQGQPPEAESEPDDGPGEDFPEGFEYAEAPNPFTEGMLFAHDPQALALALADPGPQLRTLVSRDPETSGGGGAGIGEIRDIEESALKRARTARRSRSTRRLFWRIAAVGLPFTVASLLGALGLLVNTIPAIGPAAGEFVATAGSSVGGLPLGIAIAGLPSLFIIWKTSKRSDSGFARKSSKSGKRLDPQIHRTGGQEYSAFLDEIQPLIEESRQLSSGRRSLTGENAKRLEALFETMARVGKRHGIHAAASMYGDFTTRMWRASALARRRIAFIALRRAPTRIADITAPYSTRESPRGVGRIAAYLRAPAGVLAALALLLLGGLYRLPAEEAEVLRPNQVFAFPQILDVISITNFSRDQLPEVYLDSVTAVDGPGWFWSWPAPLTEREHVNLANRKVKVESFLGLRGDGSTEIVTADITFSVRDTGKWVSLGRSSDGEREVRDRLSQLLADHVADLKEERAALPRRPANIAEAIKDDMLNVLTNFVSDVNIEAEVDDLGIHVDSADNHSFASFHP